MSIRGLLIGSAAAIVAVSGARAADAVVIPEPEPFEYVRVCDTYGIGFFFIPGTETCLRISGLIRYDIDFREDNEWKFGRDELRHLADYLELDSFGFDDELNDDEFDDDLDDTELFEIGLLAGASRIARDRLEDIDFEDLSDPDDGDVDGPGFLLASKSGLDEGWAKQAIARINIDARSETEWGTFRRYIRLQGSTSGSTDINGLSDEAMLEVVLAYVELGGLLVGLYDTLYDGEMSPEFDVGGGSAAHQVRYTFSGSNGFQFQVSIEEQGYNYDYTPNVVGRVALSQGRGDVALFAAYDATFEDVGVKATASWNVTDAIMLEGMAIYESGFGDFSVCSKNGLCGYEYSLAAGLSFKATDQLTLRVGGQYFGDQYWIDHDNHAVGGQVDWMPVENLMLRAQAKYNGGDSQDFVDGKIRLEAKF